IGTNHTTSTRVGNVAAYTAASAITAPDAPSAGDGDPVTSWNATWPSPATTPPTRYTFNSDFQPYARPTARPNVNSEIRLNSRWRGSIWLNAYRISVQNRRWTSASNDTRKFSCMNHSSSGEPRFHSPKTPRFTAISP